MNTRAQIGVYESVYIRVKPICLIYRHDDGHPTGPYAVVPELLQYVREIVSTQSVYDDGYLAAQLVYRLIKGHDGGVSGLGYGIGNELHPDIRFYYAVTPKGLSAFNAQPALTLTNLPAPLFTASWYDTRGIKVLTEEIAALSRQVIHKQGALRDLVSKQYKRPA